MNFKIKLTTKQFMRAVQKHCPKVRFETTTFTDLALGGYIGEQFIGGYPAKEFYLFDRFHPSGKSVKQIGLLHAVKKLSQYADNLDALIEDLKIGIHTKPIAMLKTDITKKFNFGIKAREYKKNKDTYLIETIEEVMPVYEVLPAGSYTSQN